MWPDNDIIARAKYEHLFDEIGEIKQREACWPPDEASPFPNLLSSYLE